LVLSVAENFHGRTVSDLLLVTRLQTG
jgi:hypothetical protein